MGSPTDAAIRGRNRSKWARTGYGVAQSRASVQAAASTIVVSVETEETEIGPAPPCSTAAQTAQRTVAATGTGSGLTAARVS